MAVDDNSVASLYETLGEFTGGEDIDDVLPPPVHPGQLSLGQTIEVARPLTEDDIQAARDSAGIRPETVGPRGSYVFDLSTSSMGGGRKRGALTSR